VTVEGAVESVNATGVRIEGQWFTSSRYRPVDLPSAGARVRLVADDKRFIKTLEVLSDAPAPQDLDRRISRLAVLKAAAAFCGGKAMTTEVSSQDVLKIAERWLEWVES